VLEINSVLIKFPLIVSSIHDRIKWKFRTDRLKEKRKETFLYSYNTPITNELHEFLKFIFGIELYIFRTVPLSIIRSLALYTQQLAYIIKVILTAC